MKIKSFVFLCFMLFMSISLSAIELKLNEEYLVENEKYEEDYFFGGEILEFNGEANDFFGFANQVDFSGKAKLAIFALGRQIDIKGSAGNGIKAGGKTIIIKGTTTGTSFLGGEKVIFEQESQTTGDTFVGARKVLVKGKITGDFYAGAGEVSIQNEIHGNVKVHAGQLKIPEQGKIFGNLIYHSDYELSDEEAARVTGDITFEQKKEGVTHGIISGHNDFGPFWLSLLFKLSFAVLGFLILLFPVTRALEKQRTHKEILSNSLWGLIPMFVYPSAFVLSMVLIITIPLGIAMLAGFIPLLFITKIIGITMIGGFIANALNITTKSRFIFFLIGVILYSGLSLIPIFGFLLMAFVSSIGCGFLLATLFQKKFA